MTQQNAPITDVRRRDIEHYLISGVLASDFSRAVMEDIITLCPRGSVQTIIYQDVWEAICAVHASGHKVDIATVFDSLLEAGATRRTENPVDPAWLASLMETPYATEQGVKHWADKLSTLNRCGDIRELLTSAIADILSPLADPDAIVAKVIKSLEGLKAQTHEATLAPLMAAILQDVEKGEGAKPMPTPWSNLNAVLKGGAAPGELVVLAARPGMGKTALAGCWAVETARKFGPVLFVSCEVKDKTLGSRMLAREGRIDNRAFREGLASSAIQFPKICAAASSLGPLPLSIIDSSGGVVTPSAVRRWARSLGKPAMVVVDYLQLMYADDKHDSREREIADMSRAMKRLAVELECPVLLLSQLNRKVEEGNREPQLSDLRESGAIEQDADIVIMLHADRRDQQGKDVPLKALVRKGRSSGVGTADLLFEKAYSDFRVNDSYRPDYDRSERYEDL